MIHPVVCNPILQPVVSVADPVRWHAGGSGLPSGLLRFYLSTDALGAQKGGIAWDGTPSIGADGVEPGHGPVATPVLLGAGKVLAPRLKMKKASDGMTGDERLWGPIYARNGLVVLKWQGVEDTAAATWAVGDVLAIRADLITGNLAVEVMA